MPDGEHDAHLAESGLDAIDRPKYPRFYTDGGRGFFRLLADGKDHEAEITAAQAADMAAQINKWLARLIRA